MSDAAIRELDALRRYLRRKKTKTELTTLADSLALTDGDALDTVITSLGFGASTASAIARSCSRLQVLGVVEDLIAEMVRAGVTSWTETQSSQYQGEPAFVPVRFNGHTLNGEQVI